MKTETIQKILGINRSVPLTLEEMGKALKICFYPKVRQNQNLQNFQKRLASLLSDHGARIISYEDATKDDGRVGEGIIVCAAGEIEGDDLPVSNVSSLWANIVIQVFDRACPAKQHLDAQMKLNAVMTDMAWNFAHVLIYLDLNGSITVCNMNGAIIECQDDTMLAKALIPKLAAPVIPPRLASFEHNFNVFDPFQLENKFAVDDLVGSGDSWAATGLLISQTPVGNLPFRNKFYRKLGSIYLDHRTGMSYGFLARQLPIPTLTPALTVVEAKSQLGFAIKENGELFEHDGQQYLSLESKGENYVVQVPEVSMISTRSGCEKTRVDRSCDVVRYRLRQGRIIFETPKGMDARADCKPSYDTLVIMAHAIGNAIVASVLARRQKDAPFFHQLKSQGLALAHWHGFLSSNEIPSNHFTHGADNPGVSCSTPQSAIFALCGKLGCLKNGNSYGGDMHVEPHHGTNFTCRSLTELAMLLEKNT